MPDYSKGFIYKITGNNCVYYGSSTKQSCAHRMTQHRYDAKRFVNGDKNHIPTSVQCFLNNDAVIELVEKFPCNCKDELTARERYYIENNECVNKIIPNRTIKEWIEDNKDKLKEYKASWNKDNYDPIKAKEYREANKETRKLQGAKYRETCRNDPVKSQAIKEYKAKWYQDHKKSDGVF